MAASLTGWHFGCDTIDGIICKIYNIRHCTQALQKVTSMALMHRTAIYAIQPSRKYIGCGLTEHICIYMHAQLGVKKSTPRALTSCQSNMVACRHYILTWSSVLSVLVIDMDTVVAHAK